MSHRGGVIVLVWALLWAIVVTYPDIAVALAALSLLGLVYLGMVAWAFRILGNLNNGEDE